MKSILVTVLMIVAVVGLFSSTITGSNGIVGKIASLGSNAGTSINALNP
jgi:hypothetical protein